MIFQKWRRDLSKLDILSQEKPVHTLPAVVAEWFDINREANLGAMSNDIAQAKIASLEAKVRAIDWKPDWSVGVMHGWSVRIARYVRGGRRDDGEPMLLPQRYILLMIARGPTKPSEKDMVMRENIVERLGGDIDRDHLMDGPGEPGTITFWTWAT